MTRGKQKKTEIRSAGVLESHPVKDHCDMCGTTDSDLEAAFQADGTPATLCYQCRIGSAELLQERNVAVHRAARKVITSWECGDLAGAVRGLGSALKALKS